MEPWAWMAQLFKHATISDSYVWTCGGVVEMVPCSWVAHLFKQRIIWDVGVSRLTNVLRVAEVWLDQYKDVLQEYWPNLTKQTQIDVGPDLAKRKLIRRKLHCKPFQYYVDTVQVFGHIHFPVDNIKHGWLINNGTGKCLVLKEDVLALGDCSMYTALYQFFEYTSEQHLRHRGLCVCSNPNGKSSLTLAKCFSVASNISTWNYTVK
ncbi:GALT5-like protein [Mya arenaria]|uniref:GALT5-like protein n=1 Tax=Mya arenaria TaxID=6604 RepID=A0ABY7EHA7_MYAAR|nr:GALT5-like protein [Mya arenaria]